MRLILVGCLERELILERPSNELFVRQCLLCLRSNSQNAADAVPTLMLGAHPFGCRDPPRCHHARASADTALAAGIVETTLRVLPDGVDAELRKHGDDAEQRTTHRRGRVDHGLGEADSVDLACVEFLQRFDQDAFTAGEAIKAADFEGLPRSEVVEAGEPLRSVGDSAGFAVVDEDAFAAHRKRSISVWSPYEGDHTSRGGVDRERLINAAPAETEREHPSCDSARIVADHARPSSWRLNNRSVYETPDVVVSGSATAGSTGRVSEAASAA